MSYLTGLNTADIQALTTLQIQQLTTADVLAQVCHLALRHPMKSLT
jgi:hypothetical protein